MPGERLHQPAGAAADLERAPGAAIGVFRKPLEFEFQARQNICGRGVEAFFVLIAASEGDIVMRVFPGALVPIGAHPVANGVFRIGHLY